MTMRLAVDHALCDGNGLCVREAPDFLTLDDADALHLLRDVVDDAALADVRRAVAICPKAALNLLEAWSGPPRG